jgi:hypothetical protein
MTTCPTCRAHPCICVTATGACVLCGFTARVRAPGVEASLGASLAVLEHRRAAHGKGALASSLCDARRDPAASPLPGVRASRGGPGAIVEGLREVRTAD